ncbi:resolvase [Synechococcus sp. CCY9202]|jgi:RNase H-fold protein (predicted Holliday junction resolvase)|uniref:resolvase n=1 Tax=Synechococcus sp. CCY9202 TaxID=174698 RepID=UPI002B20A5A1|nr:resolvase [Synechococcus sp. CCY9202]MEA5422869.1 resolvase [Synechococcus sp. CCY9202]
MATHASPEPSDRIPHGDAPQQRAGLAGLDPGRCKCGLVCTDATGQRIVAAAVLTPEATWHQLNSWCAEGLVAEIVLGNGTGCRHWQTRLATIAAVHVVEEHGSTLAARQRFWELFPPRGWRRCLPRGLRQPPRDWDDVVAQLLLERFLGRTLPRS